MEILGMEAVLLTAWVILWIAITEIECRKSE